MDNKYKIELGVKLNTDNLKSQINELDNKYKIKLGIDLDGNDLKKQINVLNSSPNVSSNKVKLGVDLDEKDLSKQINNISSKNISNNKGVPIQIDTKSLERSLTEVKNVIKDIQKSFGSLDDESGMKSLLSSINQVGNALDKVSIKFDDIITDLKTISSKDFNINFGIKMGGNATANNTAYGNEVRNNIIPQLKKQVDDLTKWYNDTYGQSEDEFGALVKLISSAGLLGDQKISNLVVSNDKHNIWNRMSDSKNLKEQMLAYKEFIDLFQRAANLKGLDVSKVLSGTSVNELIERAEKIKSGVSQTEEDFKKLENIFGGNNIDLSGISQQLESIVANLGEIRTALQGLSSGVHLDGLTTSFDKLSNSIENLISNATLIKTTLGDNLTGGLTQEYEETTQQMNQNSDSISDSTTNNVVKNEERKQNAYKKTANELEKTSQQIKQSQNLINDSAQDAIDRVTSKKIREGFIVDKKSDSDAFNAEMNSLVKKWTDSKGSIKNIKIDTKTIYDEDLQKNIEQIYKAQVTYNNGLDQTIKKTIEWGQIGTKINRDKTRSPIYGWVETSGSYSQSINQTEIKSNNFERDKKRDAANLINTINQVYRKAMDKNAPKSIQNTEHLDELKKKYDEITEAINRMKNASDGNSFEDEKIEVRKLISEYKSLVSEYKNMEKASTKDRSKDVETEKTKYSSDLYRLSSRMKKEGLDLPGFEKEIEQLHAQLANVGDTSGLHNFINELDKLKAKFGEVLAAKKQINSSEIVGINAHGLERDIENFSKANPRIKSFKTEINGATVSIENLLDDLSRVKTSGDFSIVSKRFREFKKAASDAGIEIKNVDNAFTDVKNITKEIGALEVDLIDAEAKNDVKTIENIKNRLEELRAELTNINNAYGGKFSVSQNNSLESIQRKIDFQKNQAKIKVENQDDAAAIKAFENEASKLEKLYSKISEMRAKVGKLELLDGKDNQIAELNRQLEQLENTYDQLMHKFMKKMTGNEDIIPIEDVVKFQQEIDTATQNAENKLREFDAKLADTKAKRAEDIKLKINDGDFKNSIDRINTEFNKLSVKSEELETGIQEVEKAIKDMELAAGTEDEVADVNKLIQAYERYKHALNNVNNQLEINSRAQKANLAAEKENIANQKLIDDRNVFISKVDAWASKNSASIKKFGAQLEDLKRRAQDCDKVTLNHLEKELKQIDNAAEVAGLKTKSFGDIIKESFSRYATYFSVSSVFMYAEQALRSMFEQVKAIDSAMTELKKVTNETDSSYNKFLTNAASKAKEIGTTIDGLVTSTADFARLGYSFEDARGLAEVANIYAVVGDEIEGVEGATESLISTMAAFKKQAGNMDNEDFAMGLIDRFNEIGNKFAISSGGIGEALKRSASSLEAANNTIDESIALITAANSVVQDPDRVGNAFKTISMRIRGATTELQEAGLETEGMAESTAKMREEIMALSDVDIMLND